MISLNFQRDDRWHDEVMTYATVLSDPLKRQWRDLLGFYGCLVTSISNILTMTVKPLMTPKTLNQMIVEGKAYNYLNNGNVPENQASFMNWEFIEKTFPQFDYKYNMQTYDDLPGSFYIARVVLNGNGHYINVLRRLNENNYVCFDTWDNLTKIYDRLEITFFHRMRLK